MRRRSLSREFALQILYQMDITQDDYNLCLDSFWDARTEEQIDENVINFTNELVRGVAKNLKEIDSKISQHAANWQLKRMAFVDRNVLRLGSYELMFRSDIPPKVSINEAVELVKKYSGLEAGKFVNGILDKIKPEKKP